MAAPWQALPVRLEQAPHRGAAFALSNASKRARIRSIGSRSRGSLFIFRSSPAVPPRAPFHETPRPWESGGVLVWRMLAARLVPAESSARNTIETVFCLRRNHISASALNATFSADDQWATGG